MTQVIIIGAGLSGLSAGCYAQMNDYQSHIFEHHSQPGGVAATWRRGEYLIDGGIHFVMSHKPGTALHKVYRQLGIVPACRFVDMTSYGRFIHESSGQSVVLTQDLDQIAAALKSLSPADSHIVDELIAGARGMQAQDMSTVGFSKPPELTTRLDQLKEMWAIRRAARYFVGKYGQIVAEFLAESSDPVLRSCIENLFLPGVPVYFVLMILALLADGQMGLIEEGSHGFVRAIEDRYRNLGGTVTYQATVEQILVEADRAVGVRLADGTEHRADAVVSAADGYSTIFKMLDGRYVDEKIVNRYATWKCFQPLLMISYGVAQAFPDEPSFFTVMLEQPLTIGGRELPGFFGRFFNYGDSFAPPGKTVVQVEFETEWDYWNDLQREDRARYEAEKDRLASEVLQRLEAHYPGITSRVELIDVATPYTTWRYTLNHRGSWGGWLMTPQTMTTMIRRTLPGLSNFYMAGQWVMPGGGVPPCLYSGRHAVQLLCRNDGKPFSVTEES
jgi:phytoene desaturase